MNDRGGLLDGGLVEDRSVDPRRPGLARHGEDAHGIRALRDEIAEPEERIAEAEANAATLPRRRRSLLLVTECLRGLLELQLELIEKV